MMITDPAYGALSAPQRAVLALQAAWAGKRPDPRLLAMPAAQRAEFHRLYSDAARANVRLGRLIRELHAMAWQESLAVAIWIFEAWYAAALDQVREPIGAGDARVAAMLAGGLPPSCPRDLDDLDETPAGRRAQVLKGVRDRLMGIVDRAHATEDFLEVIQGELGADPLHPDLRDLLEDVMDEVDDALWKTVAWAGPLRWRHDPHAWVHVQDVFERKT
jgi:hypothetical protein